MRLLDRLVIGVLVLLAMLLAGLQAARAAEIVPSVGLTRAASGEGNVKAFGGLALRASVLPMVKTEIGVAYRSEPFLNGDLNVKMWPVTGSVWLTPLPLFYFGGGAGLYQTTYDYKDPLLQDDTSSEFGTHLGGGFGFPLVPGIASLDLNGRYIHLREKGTLLAPGAIKQSFVTTSLGVSIRF
jgi:hypothetical protein